MAQLNAAARPDAVGMGTSTWSTLGCPPDVRHMRGRANPPAAMPEADIIGGPPASFFAPAPVPLAQRPPP